MAPGNFGKLNYKRHFNQEEYDSVYALLKSKYGKSLIENWSECTDPHKFVHEDLGIASFLLLLWKQQGPCKFVDLGCGNGLLVYILTQEGHIGRGLDVRKRKIWDTYPASTVLLEETIIPSSASVYPDADWLIGNHSDELTAWLPIMAARSNNTCQFFTIPCCPYKLSGAKFQRRKTQLSVYQDFLEYVQEVGELCNFEMTSEKMRIPSTKRICLIGRRRPSDATSGETIDAAIKDFISAECPQGVGSLNGLSRWIGEFKPRSAIEPVRNCSQVPKDVQQDILSLTKDCLLSSRRLVPLQSGRVWNRGGQLDISQVAEAVSSELLQRLRFECKGLQTLLKNHHQVFTVRSGRVEFRCPESLRTNSDAVRSRQDFKWKQKDCWFHDNHPDGCPLLESQCSYSHSVAIKP